MENFAEECVQLFPAVFTAPGTQSFKNTFPSFSPCRVKQMKRADHDCKTTFEIRIIRESKGSYNHKSHGFSIEICAGTTTQMI